MQGILRCAKYAFAPNKLKYCGPDKNKELVGYLKNKESDLGLKELLDKFEAMQPYLKLIAEANGIGDEFDDRVVEAYWLGNRLLEGVSLRKFYDHAVKRVEGKELKWFSWKLSQGAKPNHCFHVFNFFTMAGRKSVETMDSCRISWGRVVDDKKMIVKTERLVYRDGKLGFEAAKKRVQGLGKGCKVGDLVTFHWGWVCEKIDEQQRRNLEKYTKLALKLANKTI